MCYKCWVKAQMPSYFFRAITPVTALLYTVYTKLYKGLVWTDWTCNNYILLHICTHETAKNVSSKLLFELHETGRWGKQHTYTYTHLQPPQRALQPWKQRPSSFAARLKRLRWSGWKRLFLVSKKKKKTLKLSINNMKRVLFMKAASRLNGIHTEV